MIEPFDWPALVDEALNRRREEGLTQREHAALAGVSIPTLIAFDRKQTRLSLHKAMDILRVVGLVAKPTSLSSHGAFIKAAEKRWKELIQDLPEDSPSRQPHGSYAITYELSDVFLRSVRELQEHLKSAASHKYTGWPPFWVPTRKAIAPYPFDGGIECWLGQPDTERAFDDAAHSDYWRASLEGRMYLRRGYQEDAVDMVSPATIFDLTLPIWRTGEALLHAYHFAESIDAPETSEIYFSVRYSGLAGRELKAWANPYREVFGDHRYRIGDAQNSIVCRVSSIDENLPSLIHELLAPIYEGFDFFDLKLQLVEEELAKMRKDRKGF